MSRKRNYCFTSYKDTLEYDEEAIGYIVWGREICPDTGRHHLQGYVEFGQGASLSRAKAILGDPAVHLEPRGGSAKQAIDYCKKDGDIHEWGLRKRQGERSDIQFVRLLLSEGGGMRSVLAEGANFQSLGIAKVALTYLERGREGQPTVLWYWGPTGKIAWLWRTMVSLYLRFLLMIKSV